MKPLREGRTEIAQNFKDILINASGIELMDVTADIAEYASFLRAKYNMRTPDAIQIATSIIGGSEYFLTNDSRLKSIEEIRIVTLIELM